MGPPADPAGLSPPLSLKSLPHRKDSKTASPNLRTLYRMTAQDSQGPEKPSHRPAAAIVPTSPHLPPTPPGASNGDVPHTVEEIAVDGAVFRSALVTPTNQNSPPTPDNTPPRERKIPVVRPFLGTQPSLTSTRADSFTTAREDIASEDGSDIISHYQGHLGWSQSSLNKYSHPAPKLRYSALPRSSLTNGDGDGEAQPINGLRERSEDRSFGPSPNHEGTVLNGNGLLASPQALSTSSTPLGLRRGEELPSHNGILPGDDGQEVETTSRSTASPHQGGLKRDKSLRDRLLEAQHRDPSASTERFASIIGWNDSVPIEDMPTANRETAREDIRRFSGISTTSTVEAYVFESAPLPRRKTTLRHARLSNQNRWSFGSEISGSYSLASSAVLPKTEVIRVAVIPERRSSLPTSSSSGSKRQSLSTGSARSHSRKVSDNPPTAWQHRKTLSESVDRGTQADHPPTIPVRSSSLSAPTSRSTSRANSITSENLRVRRQEAEKDLRKTLDRMESDRLIQSVRDWTLKDEDATSQPTEVVEVRLSTTQASVRTPPLTEALLGAPTNEGEQANNGLGLALPGTQEWAALRPPSILETPFSQPSFRSASPEINEARAVNFFPHNNHSLQLIEPSPIHESRAVREVQKQRLPQIEVESPLRNPRRPPKPPQFKLFPPTTGKEADQRLGFNGPGPSRGGSTKRPGTYHRSDSLMSSISRGLSLKNARNKKADQELDGKLHPFWRPRAFWDDIDNPRPGGEQELSREAGVVYNSLGLPQERIVITGPVSLVRRISERRRQRRGIVKQTSHGSLAKIQATRQLYASPGLGFRFHLVGIKNVHDRVLRARQRKEHERQERRRAQLRRSIGANVIMQGDSRFPASKTSLSRDI
ncbi:hypothetical protein LTR99_010098 [Exophiala xenobiotica]|uniref:Uncharacterized protein n=1 Tax=Vermiconidia calcicola TaxID=1690605 RepID=A0AAV9PUL4_9PEZI|nr:hypothetical protein H2202_002046 [Exophiala xenobiotica]KAK5529492.1 hypothetical protein LTR25_009740 [Vermiconidia calcicola]KAK5529570.1 hypothetical protein LTR23_010682 [Chaetothyriales sp. CCFEE 6169]KAK5228684.1 hypothetical protein LTR72_002569 [Exophiala xenobiotica]KAK5293173.1 hypothetical protein LTR99_010098 [Exophiala xenobiotica]